MNNLVNLYQQISTDTMYKTMKVFIISMLIVLAIVGEVK